MLEKDSSQKTILVVEDEPPLLEAIKLKLEKSGFNVATARSVKQAQGYLKNVGSIDAMWLDHYLLGEESGLDLVIACKQENSWCHNIPIFVVSNTATADKVQSYLKLGVNKYYVKSEKRLDAIIKDLQFALQKAK